MASRLPMSTCTPSYTEPMAPVPSTRLSSYFPATRSPSIPPPLLPAAPEYRADALNAAGFPSNLVLSPFDRSASHGPAQEPPHVPLPFHVRVRHRRPSGQALRSG